MFLNLEDGIAAVNRRYCNYPAPGFTFKPSELLPSDIDAMQRSLGVKIEGEFRALLLRVNLGDLTLGFVGFGSGMSNVDYLIEANPVGSWWLLRNDNILRIGETDGFSVFVNSRRGTVYAVEAGTIHLSLVATSISRFIEVLCTLCTGNIDASSPSIVTDICDYCSCDRSTKFWRR